MHEKPWTTLQHCAKMKINCALVLFAATLCIHAVTNEANLAEVKLNSMVNDPHDLDQNPTRGAPSPQLQKPVSLLALQLSAPKWTAPSL